MKDKEIKPKKQKLPHSISHTIHLGAQSNAGLSIRERQEKRAKGKQAKQEAKAKQPKAQAEADRSETRSAENTTKLNEDTSFVDDMMAQARQKRQLDNGNTGRNKKRKSEA